MKSRPWLSSMLHDVTHVDLTMVSYGLSLRDTAVAVIPIVAATLLGNLAIGLMICIGTITVAPFARPAVDERTAGWMTIAGVIMAISAFVGSTTGSIDWLAILLTTIWALGAGLMVAIGPQVTQVGLTGVVMLLVMSYQKHPPLMALGIAGLIFLGADTANA